jgi:hypothetical protein
MHEHQQTRTVQKIIVEPKNVLECKNHHFKCRKAFRTNYNQLIILNYWFVGHCLIFFNAKTKMVDGYS